MEVGGAASMTAEVSARKTNKTRKCAPPHDYYYRWNERNLLSESSDSAYTVQYRYGADGQRALKFTSNIGRSTVYFNKMWQASDIGADWLQSKHIYLGEDRIATKYNSEGNENTQAERERVYYYHSDHFGSAQTVTNHIGQIHERLEYTPYGELWIDWRSADAPEDGTPFRFTGKELDPETGLYYFGARYLDPKTSRWLSGDPAVGEYIPGAPVNDEVRKQNQNLPGQGGVFNYVNLHVYHYAGNNPVKLVDPDGKKANYINGRIRAYVVYEDPVPNPSGGEGKYGEMLEPGKEFPGKNDGVIVYNDETGEATIFKVSDNVDFSFEQNKDGSYTFTLSGWNKFKNCVGKILSRIFRGSKNSAPGAYSLDTAPSDLRGWYDRAVQEEPEVREWETNRQEKANQDINQEHE
jgi:RHS repeat-associated protein